MNHLRNLQDMELAKMLLDPRKLAILRIAKNEPVTVKQMAEQLQEKPSRLYYHVNKLEEHGLLQLVETKQQGNLIEKYYLTDNTHRGSYTLDRSMAAANSDFILQELLNLIQQGIDVVDVNLRYGNSQQRSLAQVNIAHSSLDPREWAEKMHNVAQALSTAERKVPFNLAEAKLGAYENQTEQDEYVHVLLSYRLKDVSKQSTSEEKE
ncbi:helix-turn-helix domain-containing protein [Paenibacillus assamensis]|uniref:helix-turn-helix domain-containing protein n=1 Tax=Paenibacillus assamensis TaxID=311244 RepID=UPI00040F00A2|nr:helix-turn-helix domain-containing protein [Paenibacillus assamensis]